MCKYEKVGSVLIMRMAQTVEMTLVMGMLRHHEQLPQITSSIIFRMAVFGGRVVVLTFGTMGSDTEPNRAVAMVVMRQYR